MQKKCAQCGVSRPLQLFRRFSGRKKIMRSVCRVCDPPLTLIQMTPAQRKKEVEHGRANALVVSSMAALERAQRMGVEFTAHGLRVQAGLRRRAWDEALLRRLQREIIWADGLHDAYSLQAERWSTGTQAGLHPEFAAPWLAFLGAYAVLLRRVLHDARAALAHINRQPPPRPRLPTPEQANPHTYVFVHEVAHLRRLYGACRPIPGRRALRTPWVLEWEENSRNTTPTPTPKKGNT